MYQNQKFLIALVILFVIGISTATAQNLKLGLESGYGVSSRYSDFTGSRKAYWMSANLFVPVNKNSNIVLSASTLRNGFYVPYSAWNSYYKINLEYLSLSCFYQTFFFEE